MGLFIPEPSPVEVERAWDEFASLSRQAMDNAALLDSAPFMASLRRASAIWRDAFDAWSRRA
jgi:hypothetical protein